VDMEFEAIYQASSNLGTLVSRDRAMALYEEAMRCSHLGGEFWECGVYRGGSALILAGAIRNSKPRILRLFDTFSGLPSPSAIDIHKRGEFSSPDSVVRSLPELSGAGIYRGLAPASLVPFAFSEVLLAHLDLDLYEGTKGSLEFIFPRLHKEGSIVIDDYEWEGSIGCPGVRKAVDEFLEANDDCVPMKAADFQVVLKHAD